MEVSVIYTNKTQTENDFECHSCVKTWSLMTQMELEGIMLRKINQSEKDEYHMISLV